VPLERPSRIVAALTDRGYNADRETVTLIAESDDPERTLAAVVDAAPDDAGRIAADDVRAVLAGEGGPASGRPVAPEPDRPTTGADDPEPRPGDDADPTPDADSTVESDADPIPGSTPDSGATSDADSTSDPDPTSGSDADPTSDTESTSDPGVTPGVDSEAATGAEAAPASEPSSPTDPASGSTAASVSTATRNRDETDSRDRESPVEPKGSTGGSSGRSPVEPTVEGDVTGESTGTGEYRDFVATFRDRYERLSSLLRGRVNHRPATAIDEMHGGSEAAMVGLVNDVRSTASGHWLVELEDTTGTFPCLVMKDREITPLVDELLLDEAVAVEGTLADDGGILFVDSMHFPDVPRTFQPETADRDVRAALISDVHVGSDEFVADGWERFADWLHTDAAADVEYLLIAGDMVEGVGVYPDQDEELSIVDVYEQYERFNEHLKSVPGDLEVVMIPGNHDAVRLAEPQPGFDEDLRSIMSAHDPRIVGNPSTVTLEGVSVLMYHGVSLDEVIAELPEEKASYDDPHRAMYQLLKKRHVAPQYGGHMRLAPEEEDYLVIDSVPEVFHTGHVHKLGYGKYHGVLAVNSGCWQAQTAFQESVDIDPDPGVAPIVDLSTLELTVRKFV